MFHSYKSGNIFPLRPSAWLPVRWPWAVPYWGISMPCLLNNSQMTADCGCHELREAIRTALLCLSAPCSVVQITNNASSGLSCLKCENLHLDFGVFKPAWVLGPLVPENGLKLCLQPEGRHCLRVGTLCLPSVVGNWPRGQNLLSRTPTFFFFLYFFLLNPNFVFWHSTIPSCSSRLW